MIDVNVMRHCWLICAKMRSVAQMSKLKIDFIVYVKLIYDKMISEKLLHDERTNDIC